MSACVFGVRGAGAGSGTLIEESRIFARKNVQSAMARRSFKTQLLVITHATTMHAHQLCGRSNAGTEYWQLAAAETRAVLRDCTASPSHGVGIQTS